MMEVEQKRKQTFCKFTYCGSVDLNQLLDMAYEPDAAIQCAPAAAAELWPAEEAALLLKRLLKGKKDVLPMEKLEVVKTHLQHDHPARDGGRLQPQDLQPGGNQG